MIDAYCTLPHYAHHCAPVLEALPEEQRGRIYMPTNFQRDPLIDGYDIVWGNPPDRGGPLLVAGYQDLPITRRPKVLVSHGAGQTYSDNLDQPGYEGGPGRELVDLFLCPNETAAALNRARYPRARAVAVGCPKLDAYLQIPKPQSVPPVVAVAFHWNCRVSQESGWAWPTWRDTIIELSKTMTVLGHCHPRARQDLVPWYAEHNIEYLARVEDLLARADVLVVDNSSLGFEWSACDRPTIWIDDDSWRRDVVHGLRFGDELPGFRLDAVDNFCDQRGITQLKRLLLATAQAVVDPDSIRRMRARVAERVYGDVDGHASERAAAAVMELMTPRLDQPTR